MSVEISLTKPKLRMTAVSLWRWPHLVLGLILLFSLGLHFITIVQPQKLLIDEGYYVTDARSILAGDGTMLPQHTPFAKIMIMEGIRLFGDNPFGWRFFSVIFGALGILFFYLICRQLGMSGLGTNLATFFFSFENLSFVQTSVAMLDPFLLAFALMAVWAFLRNNMILSGLLAALSILAKIPGVFVLGIFFIYSALDFRQRGKSFALVTTYTVIAFFLFMPLLDYALNMKFFNPLQRIEYIMSYASQATFSHNFNVFASRPWDWLMNKGAIFFSYDPQLIAIITPTICALIIPVVLYMACRGARGNQAARFGLIWFACSYLPWIVITLVTDRQTYIYYFYPVIGAVSIGLGLFLSDIITNFKNNRHSKVAKLGVTGAVIYLIIHLAGFIILSPIVPSFVKWLHF